MTTETAREPFTIDDADKASWAVDKILSARERVERVKAQYQAALNEAELEARDAEAFFLPLLEEWYDTNPPRKGKSIKLPHGNLSKRTVPGGPRVLDPDAVLAWAKEHGIPGLIRVKEEISRTAVREYIESTGDLPDGAEIVPSQERFDVR
jgi:phage host-nuclease inhibitor protein Gam